MDSVLLDALTILLSQALPLLRSAGGKAAGKAVEEVGKQTGAGALAGAKTIWEKLRGKVEAKPAAAEAAEDVAREPDNEDARISLRHQLAKILAADPELAAEIAPLVEAARPAMALHSIQVRDQGAGASDGGTAAHWVALGAGAQAGNIFINANAGPADAQALWQDLGTPRPSADLTGATAAYLRNLVQRYQYLDFKGLGVSDRLPLKIPLLEMYVPLKARVETPEGDT